MTHDQLLWMFFAMSAFNLMGFVSIHMGMHVLYNRIKGPPEEAQAAKAKAA